MRSDDFVFDISEANELDEIDDVVLDSPVLPLSDAILKSIGIPQKRKSFACARACRVLVSLSSGDVIEGERSSPILRRGFERTHMIFGFYTTPDSLMRRRY